MRVAACSVQGQGTLHVTAVGRGGAAERTIAVGWRLCRSPLGHAREKQPIAPSCRLHSDHAQYRVAWHAPRGAGAGPQPLRAVAEALLVGRPALCTRSGLCDIQRRWEMGNGATGALLVGLSAMVVA